jgi:predicted N-acetyltransferase YhbS
MRIRPARAADLEPALAVIGTAFGMTVRTPSVHTLVAGAPGGALLVAEHEGRIVGTGAAVGFGPTGWIGGVTVAAEARGARLGQALTEAAIATLGARETVLLLASAAGLPTYERLGFEPDGRYRVFAPPANAPPPPAARGVARGHSPPPTAPRSWRSISRRPASGARSRSTRASPAG